MIWRDRKDDAGSNGGEAEPASSAGDPEGSDVESILTSRVESILEAAEEAAAGIRQDAEERAGDYLEEARIRADDVTAERIRQISELTDTLVNRVRAVAQQSDELIAALDDAGRRVTGEAQPEPELEAPEPQPYEAVSPPSPYLGAEPPAPAPPPPEPPPVEPPQAAPRVSDGARLLATQMAVAGSNRDEIAWRLHEEFGIQDASAILDEIGI